MNTSSYQRKSRKAMSLGFISIILLILLDQATKAWAQAVLRGGNTIMVIPGVFQLTYLENQSAAFSMDPVSLLQRIFRFSAFEQDPQLFLRAKMVFFILLTVFVILAMLWLYIRIPENKRFIPIDLVLILFIAGAFGNLIDRIVNQYVIDFLYFVLIDFPIFNVADIYVTCASAAFVLLVLFYYREEEFEAVFPKKKERP